MVPPNHLRPPPECACIPRMRSLRHVLRLATTAPIGLTDLTGAVRDWVREAGLRDGLLVVASRHTTARITVNEREPELERDIVAFLERLAPAAAGYRHDRDTVDGRPNAHAHLLGLFLNASETIPVVGGELQLGAWQALLFVELDGPRPAREVELTFLGAA